MRVPARRDFKWLALLFLVTAALVLARYGRVQATEPLVRLATTAGWLVLFSLACLGAGGWLARILLGQTSDGLAQTVLALAFGAALLALAAFVFASVGWLAPAPLLSVLGVAAALGLRGYLHRRGWAAARPVTVSPWLAGLIVTVGVVTLLAASVPSGFYDALGYHLAFPYHWLRHHRMIAFPRDDYSFLPANMGMLYTYALSLGWPAGAQAIHWWMGALATASTAAIAARLGESRPGSWWSAALLATAPVTVLSATWAASDLGVAAFAAGAWLMVAMGWRDRSPARRSWWFACGGLTGMAVGCKVVALATVAVPLAIVMLLPWGTGGQSIRGRDAKRLRLVWFGLGAAVLFLPWMTHNLALTGNPLYPLLGTPGVGGRRAVEQALLGGLVWSPDGIGRWIVQKLSVVLLGTFSPQGAAGNIGPAYLILLPLLLVWAAIRRNPLQRLLLVGALTGVAAWGLVPQLGRYLLPSLLLLAALCGAAWGELMSAWPGAIARWLGALLALILGWSTVGAISPEVISRLACSIGQLPAEEWMAQSVDYWAAAEFINGRLPSGAKILLVAEARCMYIDRDVVVEDPFQTPYLSVLAEREGCPAGIVRSLKRTGVTHLLINSAEGERIAAMTGRKDYFGLPPGSACAALDGFLSRCVTPVFGHARVSVVALDGGVQ